MELKLILEALLFSAQKPLSLKDLRDVFAAAVEHADALLRQLGAIETWVNAAGISKSMLIVTPGGIAVDRKIIRGPI